MPRKADPARDAAILLFLQTHTWKETAEHFSISEMAITKIRRRNIHPITSFEPTKSEILNLNPVKVERAKRHHPNQIQIMPRIQRPRKEAKIVISPDEFIKKYKNRTSKGYKKLVKRLITEFLNSA